MGAEARVKDLLRGAQRVTTSRVARKSVWKKKPTNEQKPIRKAIDRPRSQEGGD